MALVSGKAWCSVNRGLVPLIDSRGSGVQSHNPHLLESYLGRPCRRYKVNSWTCKQPLNFRQVGKGVPACWSTLMRRRLSHWSWWRWWHLQMGDWSISERSNDHDGFVHLPLFSTPGTNKIPFVHLNWLHYSIIEERWRDLELWLRHD